MSELAEQLRKQIDARHTRALQALQELEDYLNDPNLLERNGAATTSSSSIPVATPTPKKPKKGRPRKDSFRTRVLAIITTEWATVGAIATRIGLEPRQARGVINAPGLAARIERRTNADGQTEYHLSAENNS